MDFCGERPARRLTPKPDARNAATRPAKARGHCQKRFRDATSYNMDLRTFLRFFASSIDNALALAQRQQR
jgi:hypothetical protein